MIKHVCSYNSSSIKKAGQFLGTTWETCQPGVHHDNAIIQKCRQEFLNDTRGALFQAGLPGSFWLYASPYAAHIQKLTLDPDKGSSLRFLRYTQTFLRQGNFLGVEYGSPCSHQVCQFQGCSNRSYRIFLGCWFQTGRLWSEEYLFANLDDFGHANSDVDAPGSDF